MSRHLHTRAERVRVYGRVMIEGRKDRGVWSSWRRYSRTEINLRPPTKEGRKLDSVSCLQAVARFSLIPAADEASSPPAVVVFLGVSSSYSPVERLNSTLP